VRWSESGFEKPGEGGKLVRKVEKVLVTWKLEQRYSWPSVIMQYQGPYGTDFGKVLVFVSPTLAAMVIFTLWSRNTSMPASLWAS
jgi:hypothetical protein